MSEQTALITAADVTARLSAQAYRRLFAKDGGSTVDPAFLALCIAQANSEVRTLTRAAFPSGIYQTTDTLDPAVVGQGVALCLAIAVSAHLSTDEHEGFAVRGKRAREFFRAMSRDADVRPPGSSQTPARPRATLTNATTGSGASTSPYGRAADGRDDTGF